MDAKSDLDRKTEAAALIKDGTHGKDDWKKWCEIRRYTTHYGNFRYFRGYSVVTYSYIPLYPTDLVILVGYILRYLKVYARSKDKHFCMAVFVASGIQRDSSG